MKRIPTICNSDLLDARNSIFSLLSKEDLVVDELPVFLKLQTNHRFLNIVMECQRAHTSFKNLKPQNYERTAIVGVFKTRTKEFLRCYLVLKDAVSNNFDVPVAQTFFREVQVSLRSAALNFRKYEKGEDMDIEASVAEAGTVLHLSVREMCSHLKFSRDIFDVCEAHQNAVCMFESWKDKKASVLDVKRKVEKELDVICRILKYHEACRKAVLCLMGIRVLRKEECGMLRSVPVELVREMCQYLYSTRNDDCWMKHMDFTDEK